MRKLRIAVSANFFYPDKARAAYPPKTLVYGEVELLQWLVAGGAVPYLIPPLPDDVDLDAYLDEFDGIVFSGGADVCPRSYGEEPLRPEWSGDAARDVYEVKLFNTALQKNMPILGICRGHQLINVALGGTLYQDTYTQCDGAIIHRDGEVYDGLHHQVNIFKNTVLSNIYKNNLNQKINTIHHQAIKDLGDGLVVQARAVEDDVIEAVWLDRPDTYVLGIQWHPEWIKDEDVLDPDLIRAHYFNYIMSRNNLT